MLSCISDLINRSNIPLEGNEIEDNVDEVDVFYSNEMEQDSADTKNENTEDAIPPSTIRYQEYDYSIDSIVYDIGLWHLINIYTLILVCPIVLY